MEKTDVTGIYRNGNGLVNTDSEALKAYKKRKENLRAIKDHEDRMDRIEDEMKDIKSLLQKLVDNKDSNQ